MKNMKELQRIVKRMNESKDFAGSVFSLDEMPTGDVVSTGSLSLDTALGIGGLPNNRVIEIAGPPGAGKTTLSFSIARNVLTKYPDTAMLFLDLEGRLEPKWLEKHIPDPEMRDRIIVGLPDSAEHATAIYEEFVRSGDISIVVYDSIASAPAKANVEKSALIGNVGGNSKAITAFAQSSANLSNKYKCLTLGLNQVRDVIGARYPTKYAPGGNAWEHACSARIWLTPDGDKLSKVYEDVKGQETQVGYKINALIKKCSFAPPFRKASWWFYNVDSSFGFGIDQVEEIVRLSTLVGVVKASGAWYSHPAIEGTVQGTKKLTAMIKADESLREIITRETRAALRDSEDLTGVIETFKESEIAGMFDEEAASSLISGKPYWEKSE